MNDRVLEFALWRRLDTPGHDAAFLSECEAGYLLQGTSVFLDPNGPACIAYTVQLDHGFSTLKAGVHGHVGSRQVDHAIERTADAWFLDGQRVDGLAAFVDVDFGFTPATNMQLLRRTAPRLGEALDVSVVWFDVDQTTLIELPQRYERRKDRTYWYESPTAAYEGFIELAPNGFAQIYPELWLMESPDSPERA